MKDDTGYEYEVTSSAEYYNNGRTELNEIKHKRKPEKARKIEVGVNI